jgi:hypothetical protein
MHKVNNVSLAPKSYGPVQTAVSHDVHYEFVQRKEVLEQRPHNQVRGDREHHTPGESSETFENRKREATGLELSNQPRKGFRDFKFSSE